MIAQQHNITTPSGKQVYVFEVPNTYFNNVQLCLSTKDVKEIKKVKHMVPLFKKFLDEISRGRSSLIIGAN